MKPPLSAMLYSCPGDWWGPNWENWSCFGDPWKLRVSHFYSSTTKSAWLLKLSNWLWIFLCLTVVVKLNGLPFSLIFLVSSFTTFICSACSHFFSNSRSIFSSFFLWASQAVLTIHSSRCWHRHICSVFDLILSYLLPSFIRNLNGTPFMCISLALSILSIFVYFFYSIFSIATRILSFSSLSALTMMASLVYISLFIRSTSL